MDSPDANSGVSRRRVFALALGWLAAGSAVAAAAAAAVRFMVPNVLFEPSQRFRAGKPEDYPEGSVTFLDEEQVFLIRQDNTFRCLSAICTHLGCTVNRAERGYHCPCHGSVFDDQGKLRNFVNVYVNDEDVRHLAGLDTPVREGDELTIVPAIAGGAPCP